MSCSTQRYSIYLMLNAQCFLQKLHYWITLQLSLRQQFKLQVGKPFIFSIIKPFLLLILSHHTIHCQSKQHYAEHRKIGSNKLKEMEGR